MSRSLLRILGSSKSLAQQPPVKASSRAKCQSLLLTLDKFHKFAAARPQSYFDLLYVDRTKYPLPSLVLLDIKLPLIDGFEVLKWIRGRADFAPLSVVMLTSSDHICDVNLAFQLGANSFLVKPLDFWNVMEVCKPLRMMGRPSKVFTPVDCDQHKT